MALHDAAPGHTADTRWALWPSALGVFGLSLASVKPILLLALAGIASALGLIAGVTVLLAHTALHDPLTVVPSAVAFPIRIWRPLASPALIALGAAVGIVAGR